MDRFVDEVGGPMFVSQRDGVRIVQAGHDQDGNAFAARQRPDARAGEIPVHLRHHDVKHDEIRSQFLEDGQRLLTAGGFGHDHAGRFEGSTDEQACSGVVVDDENDRTALTHSRMCDRHLWWRCSGYL